MDNDRDLNVTKMRHFAKIHERIQNKYIEMQRKLEKSKSVDSLVQVIEENIQEDIVNESTNKLINDDVFESENGINNIPLMQTATVEDIQKLTFTQISEYEPSASVSEDSVSDIQRVSENNDKADNEFTDELFINEWALNSESVNNLIKDNDETTSLPPAPKLSIRNKIGSRLSAARERRREIKEKNLLKKKESETGPKVEKLIFSTSTKSDLRLREKRLKIATVTIALIDVTGLETDPTEERQRSLQCRFRLGTEKCKSKLIKNVVTSSAKWQELFNMNMYDENSNLLEICLWDMDRKDIGKITVDLLLLEKEKTHALKLPLEGITANTEIFFLLTITGTAYDDLLVDVDNYQDNLRKYKEDEKNYVFYQLDDFSKVGRLSVIVYGAKGLASSDSYCNFKLINERRQTHTEYKTNEPNWMKSFTFDLTDVTSILQVIVYDERRNDEVGKVAIPLLSIKNGAKVWYALKDPTLRERAKGNNPRILLEMRISWNIIKASVRVIKPKEIDFLKTEEGFDRKLFLKNVARAKTVVLWTTGFLKGLKACFEWESRKWNTVGIIFWLFFNWYYSPWMVPLLLLIPFVWYRPPNYYLVYWKSYFYKKEELQESIEKEEKTTLRQKINSLQELIYTVQKFIGQVTSFGERVKNLFNFTVPYLSLLAIFFIIGISIFVYIVPAKYILIGWGIKKYVRKIIWPNRVPHNEMLDLISRVPDDEVLIDCETLPLEHSQKDQSEDNV